MYICVYIHIHIYVCIYVYVYIHIYTYVYTYITYINMFQRECMITHRINHIALMSYT